METDITVYGTADNEDTLRVREFLATRSIHFQFVDVAQDKSAEQIVKDANDGKLRTPLVIVQFGTEARKLRAPSNQELEDALRDLEPLDRAA